MPTRSYLKQPPVETPTMQRSNYSPQAHARTPEIKISTSHHKKYLHFIDLYTIKEICGQQLILIDLSSVYSSALFWRAVFKALIFVFVFVFKRYRHEERLEAFYWWRCFGSVQSCWVPSVDIYLLVKSSCHVVHCLENWIHHYMAKQNLKKNINEMQLFLFKFFFIKTSNALKGKAFNSQILG